MWVKNNQGTYTWEKEAYTVAKKTCRFCGKEFPRDTKNQTSWKARKYCTIECANKGKNNQIA